MNLIDDFHIVIIDIAIIVVAAIAKRCQLKRPRILAVESPQDSQGRTQPFEIQIDPWSQSRLHYLGSGCAWECCQICIETNRILFLLALGGDTGTQICRRQIRAGPIPIPGGDIHLLSILLCSSMSVPGFPHGGGVRTAYNLDETARIAQDFSYFSPYS